MKNINFIGLAVLFNIYIVTAQTQITGTIKGQVLDQANGEPLPFTTVQILETNPIIGGVTDLDGNFQLSKVPVGRYTIKISSVGYENYLIKELLVTSGKDVVINVNLKESFVNLHEVIVTPGINKLKTVNDLAGINARMLSVEEANRYAGGFNDPARLASSFAGVSSGIQSNGIVVRGNNPGALLWRMEGVEISNPNHFADLASFGGGGLTALSSQMLANSDFSLGAFPSAYTNAISGVFDLSMRSGNNDKRENTFQAGIIGIDASSEGPLSKNSSATYLFNYRYSTIGLLEPILPEEAGGTNYQDLAFKFKFPTKTSGLFSLWGIGLIDNSGQSIEENMTKWEYESDQLGVDIKQYMGSSGLKHVIYVGESSFLESDIAITSNELSLVSDKMTETGDVNRDENIKNGNWNWVGQTKFNSQLGKGNVMEFGVRSYFQNYDLFLQHRDNGTLRTLVDDKGSTMLSSAYGLAKLLLSDQWTFQSGINFQHFSLNGQSLIEPRASLEWHPGIRNSFGMAYGLHSRTERLNYYLNRDQNGIQQNKNLKMTRSHHFVATYGLQLNENLRLKIETYFQQLFDVPVLLGTSFSFINLKNDWFISDKLVNRGKGRNYGLEVTLERFLNKGYYYLLTGSVFKSEYNGGDGIWRSTTFDRGVVANALIGKEWMTGASKSNILGINCRVTYQGGQRYIPIDESASILAMDAVEDEMNAYSSQLDGNLILHFSSSYRKNKPNHSSVWTLSVLNATMVKEFQGFAYNRQTNAIDQLGDALIIPNLSYKIEF